MKLRILTILCVLLTGTTAFSFTVILKSGKKVEGTWIAEDQSTIRVKDQKGIIISFRKDTLDLAAMSRMSRNALRSVAPAKSGEPNVRETAKVTEFSSQHELNSASPISSSLTSRSPEVQANLAKEGKLWSVQMDLANVFDSNINHDEESLDSIGIVYGLAARYQNRAARPSFELRYAIAKHSYSETEQWDRISHNLQATYERRLTRALRLELEGEIAIKGSSEDREIGNQYIVGPLLKYRFGKQTEIGTFAAYRLKRYDDDPERNATNRYAGLLFIRKFGDNRLEVSYRYESNDSDGPRNQYIRNTYSAQYSILVNKTYAFSFGAKYRPQRYQSRFIEIEVEDGPDYEVQRYDKRWVFSIDSAIPVGKSFELLPSYQYETRSSNDEEKDFSEHLPSLTLRYRW
jgi:hypothetical protein